MDNILKKKLELGFNNYGDNIIFNIEKGEDNFFYVNFTKVIGYDINLTILFSVEDDEVCFYCGEDATEETLDGNEDIIWLSILDALAVSLDKEWRNG